MNTRPIKKLAVQGTIRQRTAREASGLRYLGFFASIAALYGLRWAPQAPAFPWFVYALAVVVLIVLWRPWHHSLLVEMDHSKLHMHVAFLGIFPFLSREYDLAERRLILDQRTTVVEVASESGAALGCLALALPFPISLFVKTGGDSNMVPGVVHKWVLCTQDWRTGNTEDLLLLADRHVAVPFLDAAREVLPDHVEQV